MSQVSHSVATADAVSTISTYLTWLARTDGPTNILVKLPTEKVIGNTLPTTQDALAYLASGGDDYQCLWASVQSLKPSAIGKIKPSKSDVLAYRYLAIDVDSKVAHALKACSTDNERAMTEVKAEAIATYLQSYGLPMPLRVMSGNGSLLLYPIDLPYTDANYAMMERVAEALSDKFNDEHCDIDRAVIKDPARVLGIIGTWNRKAENASQGRLAKLRVVVGDYPPNNPMTAEAFTAAVNAIIADNTSSSILAAPHNAGPQNAGPNGWDTVAIQGENTNVMRCRKYLMTIDDAVEGSKGSDQTLRAACECFRFGLSNEQAKMMMEWFNATKCQPSWADADICRKLDDAYKMVASQGAVGSKIATVITASSTPEASKTTITAGTDYPMSDVGNAEHFRDANGDDVKYVVAWKAWLIWDGSRWARDTTDKVRRLALKHVRRTMPRFATTIKDDERRTKYLKWASQSQSESKVDSMLSLASSLMACSPNDFDANPNLFNVGNGTIELDTQRFRPHDRRDLLMKIAAVKYDAAAVAPTWNKFVSRIFQNENGEPRVEVVEYVKRAVGYSMTADVSAQCFFVLHGKGKNGKTTFVDAVKNVMGEYAKNGMQSLLMKLGAGNGNRNTDDEADLFGMRLIAVSETDEGMRFDASKVKRLVDTSNIRAMRKFEHSFEFVPNHKLWLCCNHMPKVDGNDDAMKRRLKKIPFMVQIPSHERDEHLGDKLGLESSGIFNWMLQGLKAWQADGRKLSEPREIADAVGEYFHANDAFGSFLSERIEPSDFAKVAVGNAYAAYCGWAEENGLTYKLSKIEFGKRMNERGYVTKISHSVRYFSGCSLASHSKVEDDAVEAYDDRAF